MTWQFEGLIAFFLAFLDFLVECLQSHINLLCDWSMHVNYLSFDIFLQFGDFLADEIFWSRILLTCLSLTDSWRCHVACQGISERRNTFVKLWIEFRSEIFQFLSGSTLKVWEHALVVFHSLFQLLNFYLSRTWKVTCILETLRQIPGNFGFNMVLLRFELLSQRSHLV